jgi:hypothetical protein
VQKDKRPDDQQKHEICGVQGFAGKLLSVPHSEVKAKLDAKKKLRAETPSEAMGAANCD